MLTETPELNSLESPPAQPDIAGLDRLAKTNSNPSNQPRKTIFRKLFETFGSIVFVLAVAEILARTMVLNGRPVLSGDRGLDAKFAIARENKEDVHQLLIVGTSLAQRGVWSELLTAELTHRGFPTRAQNLAVPETGPTEATALIDEATEGNRQGTVVFVDLKPEVFNTTFINKSKIERTGFSESYIGRKHNPNTDLLGRALLMLEDNFCLIRDRAFLRDQVFNLLQNATTFNEKYFGDSKFFRLENISWIGSKPMCRAVNPVVLSQITVRQRKAFRWSDENVKEWTLEPYFKPLKSYCEEHGMPLVLVWFPEYTPVGEPYPTRRNEALKKLYQQLADDHHVWFLDLHDSDSDWSHFGDRRHLNLLGSAFATKRIADWLTQKDNLMLLPPRSEAAQQSQKAQSDSDPTEGEDAAQ